MLQLQRQSLQLSTTRILERRHAWQGWWVAACLLWISLGTQHNLNCDTIGFPILPFLACALQLGRHLCHHWQRTYSVDRRVKTRLFHTAAAQWLPFHCGKNIHHAGSLIKSPTRKSFIIISTLVKVQWKQIGLWIQQYTWVQAIAGVIALCSWARCFSLTVPVSLPRCINGYRQS